MKGIVLFSGYNDRAIIAFCRVAEKNNVNFHIFSKFHDDKIFLSSYSKNVFVQRISNELDHEWCLNTFQDLKNAFGYDEIILFPSSEFLNRFFLTYREKFLEVGVSVPLSKEALYESVSDKYSFGLICKQSGIKVPAEYDLIPNSYPYVAKPKRYLSSSGKQLKPYLIYGEHDLRSFQHREELDDFYFQQFVLGRSYYLLFYLSNQKGDVVFSQENLVQQADGGSIICAKSSDLHKNEITERFLRLLKSLEFEGFIMIELRAQNNEYYMIEANPRPWGPIQLTVDAGVPIFQKFLEEKGLINENDVSRQLSEVDPNVLYYWSGGIIEDQNNEKIIAFHNYTSSEFFENIKGFTKYDIYLREDTMDLYRKENKG